MGDRGNVEMNTMTMSMTMMLMDRMTIRAISLCLVPNNF